ncbi:MAG: hypothetical protein ACRDB1_14440 [Microcoleaceae cyanobacterium]
MLWAKNKPNLSVVFTEESADQKLLEAIDKELTANKYQTFSNLCKQAIWQFLYESPTGNTGNTANSIGVSTSGIEKSISELAQKFNLLEQQLAGKESAQLQEMVMQLERLSQQLTKMQANLDMKFIETVETLKSHTVPLVAPSPQPTVHPATPPIASVPATSVTPQSNPATPNPSPIKPFEPIGSVTTAQITENPSPQAVPENLPVEEEEEVDPVIKRLQGMMESF